MVRLRWKSDGGFYGRGFRSAWNHDYPRAEQHLAQIVKALTAVDIRTDASLILTLDDPVLFNHPIAFMWEPGFWNLTDKEAETFRAYLLKGGFAIFEDFRRAGAVARVRAADAPRPARRAVRQARQQPSPLRHVLRDQEHRRDRAPDERHPSELLRDLRGQTIPRSA
jgi:hypothetical protein